MSNGTEVSAFRASYNTGYHLECVSACVAHAALPQLSPALAVLVSAWRWQQSLMNSFITASMLPPLPCAASTLPPPPLTHC